jgi:hypothetical protein
VIEQDGLLKVPEAYASFYSKLFKAAKLPEYPSWNTETFLDI